MVEAHKSLQDEESLRLIEDNDIMEEDGIHTQQSKVHVVKELVLYVFLWYYPIR